MDILTKIDNLISDLDTDSDYLLIELLKQKKVNYPKQQRNRYLQKHEVTDKEIARAKERLIKIIIRELSENNAEYIKVTKILNRSSCELCKYSEKYEYNWGGVEHRPCETDRCTRCTERYDVLENHQQCIRILIEIRAKDVVNNNAELVKSKAIINKINLKIQKLKDNETSKH